MKKTGSLFLIFVLAASLCACSKAIVYQEETEMNGWLKEHTQGYYQVTPSSLMELYIEEEGFKVSLSTGSDMIPKLRVENDAVDDIVEENRILTVTSSDGEIASASHKKRVFDPYRNAYVRALQVWQKSETNFRVFLWLYAEDTDFYPIPKLLTKDQYDQALALVEAYDVEQAEKDELAGKAIVNYTGDFINLYNASYGSEKAENPKGDLYYECVGTTAYGDAYRSLFAKIGLTEQDWRNSFKSLGYTGQELNLQIVYFDLTVGDSAVSLSLQTEDAYSTARWKAQNPAASYAFCPVFAETEYIILTEN